MKRLLSTKQDANVADTILLILRIGISSLMLVHGVPKLMMLLSPEPAQFPEILGLNAQVSLFLAVFAEVLCSLFLLLGLGTRFAVIPLIITMLVAILIIHGTDPFNKKELAIHYLITYIVLFATGSGRYSFDYLLQRKAA